MMGWNAATWTLLSIFLGLLASGIAVCAFALGRSSDDRHTAESILDERLARGEIEAEEHQQRLNALGGRRKPTGAVAKPLAIALIASGLVGSIVVAAVGPGSGHGLMRDMMGGGSMKGSGKTGRTAPSPSAGAQDIHVAAAEFHFSPDELRIHVGQTVNIVFDNRGRMFHTLTVGDLGFELQANAGDSIAGALRVDRAGRYTFICSVPGHEQAGMRAIVIVS